MMAEIHKVATIDAPIARVFDIVDDPSTFPKYVPNVREVVDVHRSDRRVGDSFRVIYRVLGITFDEKFTVTDYQRPDRIKSKFEGGMKGMFAWTFEQRGESTNIRVDVDYQLAGGPLGKAVDAVMLKRINEKTIDDLLKNLGRLATGEGTAKP